MARATKAKTRTVQERKAVRSTPKPAKTAAEAPAPKSASSKSPADRAPMVTKDELRVQVEKLERTIATLRAKGREATKAAKAAAFRIAELEDEVATLGKQAASQAASSKRSAKRSEARERDSIDPGDAVAERAPHDGEAGETMENIEELGRSNE